jgi:hypothetical protein
MQFAVHMRWPRALVGASLALLLAATDAVAQGPQAAVARVGVSPATAVTPAEGQGQTAQPPANNPALPCPDCARRKQPVVAFFEWQIGMWGAWTFNKLNGDFYADVDPRNWWNNATGRWDWDPNTFGINQMGHPVQGATYFNGYRTNGYGFWTSSLAALAGSFTWECCGEKNLPSINDLITTWIGGTTLGEVTRRLSDLTLDNSARGSERVLRETAAGLLNPVRLVDRLARGHAWQQGANPDHTRPDWMRGAIGVGALRLENNRTLSREALTGTKLATRFTYGRPESVIGRPFSHFELDAELTSLPESRLYYMRSRGSLFGRQLDSIGKSDARLVSFLRYDYVKNSAFELGAQSVSLGLQTVRQWSPRTRVVRDYTVRAIPLASVEDDLQSVTEVGRNYDYAFGVGVGTDAQWIKEGTGVLKTNILLTALRTANGLAQSHLLSRVETYAQIDVGTSYGIGLGFRDQRRRSFYGDGVARTASSPEVWLTVLRALPSWAY